LYSQVRLIAVDSNGVPVTEPAILQAAAEQAGIVFILRDETNQNVQITIDRAMQVDYGCWVVVLRISVIASNVLAV